MISPEARVVEERLGALLGIEAVAVRAYVVEVIEERLWRGEARLRRTGIRFVRGSHSGDYVRDPEGTDVLPPGVQPPPENAPVVARR